MSGLNRRMIVAGLAGLAMAATMSAPALAKSPEEIKAAGVIRVGMDVGLKPYAFPDGSGSYIGADVTVAKMIADDLGVKLEIVPVTSPNRVPYIVTDKVDIVIATLANTPERAEVIDFSIPYSGSFVVVSAPKALAIATLDDLIGKDVGLTRGTTFDKLMTEKAPAGVNIVRFDAEDTTLAALTSGQLEIGVHNIAVLTQLQEASPAKEFEAKINLQEVKFAIGIPKGADALRTYLDEFIKAHHADGSLNTAFKDFLGVDLPTSVTGG